MRQYILLFVFVFIAAFTIAQDSKVSTGMVDFNSQDYAKALKSFNVALENPGMLKAKNQPKAYFYRGQTLVRLYAQYYRDKETEKLKGLSDAYLRAYDDYQAALSVDADGKWKSKIEAQLLLINGQLLNQGLTSLNRANKATTEEDKAKEYALSMRYLNGAATIDPTNYMAYDLRAQASLAQEDTVAAKNDFKTAITKFKETLPAQPDQLIGYSFYRLALIERYRDNDLEASLKTISDGAATVDAEHKRLEGMKANFTPEDWASIEKQYNDAKKDLNAFKLDIYLNSPDKLQEALKEFETAIQNEPNDYIKHVAYASLLEKIEPKKAVDIYLKAIKIDDTKELAFFNLGALYNNIAKELFDKANDEEDLTKSNEIQEEATAVFGEAFPMFEKALEINPTSIQTVRALRQIAIFLGKEDALKKYKDLEAQLKGG